MFIGLAFELIMFSELGEHHFLMYKQEFRIQRVRTHGFIIVNAVVFT